MFGYIVLACHISFTSVKLDCSWIVRKQFDTLEACEVYDESYVLRKGERFGNCDELKAGAKEGDRTPALIIQK